ncbi:hypothetical protein OE88DRAFT_1233148 [Heliocybe sulcata]|uniref:Uncharacterized protein n=1 Tax=Heliocybe sulcata TaxID=5364 RepID=A0A5C3N625_9AGAM|nr:hypothetical protein OE88DRAFT_1233148 [Heliocybe sulcata]
MTDSPQPSAVSVTSPQIARSPLNAVLNGTNNGPSSSSTGNNSPAQLAAMLATSFREVDGLKRELSMMRRRAEKAERLLAALSTPMSATSGPGSSPSSLPTPTPLHENALKQIKQLENDKDDLEMQRDEALARLRVVSESWQELERYLSVVDLRASDARAGFSRIVADGGGQLVLAPIPVPGQYPHPLPLPRPRAPSIPHRGTVTFPQLPLPPPPNPNPNVSSSSRRPRAPSLDAAGYPAPPSKRHRSGRERARDSFIDSVSVRVVLFPSLLCWSIAVLSISCPSAYSQFFLALIDLLPYFTSAHDQRPHRTISFALPPLLIFLGRSVPSSQLPLMTIQNSLIQLMTHDRFFPPSCFSVPGPFLCPFQASILFTSLHLGLCRVASVLDCEDISTEWDQFSAWSISSLSPLASSTLTSSRNSNR